MENPAPAAQPTVKLTPAFSIGETVIHKFEATLHKIISITAAGLIQLEGRAGLIEPSALEKNL